MSPLAISCEIRISDFIFVFTVESDYIVQQNATSYSTTVVSTVTSGTVRIPFSFAVERDFFGTSFLTNENGNGFIGLQILGSGFLFGSNGNTVVQHNSVARPEVEFVNDVTRGVTYVVQEEIVYTYTFDSPVTERVSAEFIVNLFISGPGDAIVRNRIPFIVDTVDIVPPSKIFHYHQHNSCKSNSLINN